MPVWHLGTRLLLAASCIKCGKLFPGSVFHRHRRNNRDKNPYIDRRCPNCKWGAKAKAKQYGY